MALKWRIFHLLTFYLYRDANVYDRKRSEIVASQNCGVEPYFYIIEKYYSKLLISIN